MYQDTARLQTIRGQVNQRWNLRRLLLIMRQAVRQIIMATLNDTLIRLAAIRLDIDKQYALTSSTQFRKRFFGVQHIFPRLHLLVSVAFPAGKGTDDTVLVTFCHRPIQQAVAV